MKIFYTVLLFLFATANTFSQAPEKMSYQAVLRDATNTLLTNQEVGMQISILQTSITGTSVYLETQTPTTNINGLVSIEIGTGTSSDDFSAIDWSAGPYFIKTATDPTGGTSYTITGTSQLMSVPFAMYAKTSGSSTPGPQGEPGAQGTNGTPGIQGATGSAGADGTNGEKGDTGDQGAQGIQGDQGVKGTAGADGAAGTNGEKGDTGTQGETGITGSAGENGANGTAGADGATGAAGTNGEKGDTGDQGTQGIQGETGTAGADGLNGEKGDTGDQGTQGIQGETGSVGTNGTQGETGAQGIQGETGAAGTNGTNGDDGATGPQGSQGPAGQAGQGGLVRAADGIVVTGSGTVADPYIVSTKTYTIGLFPELGGYVFWLTPDGKHGLVAEITDQGKPDQTPNSRDRGLEYLVATSQNHSTMGNNFIDWRLPTISELEEMWNRRGEIGGFLITEWYWSSTEYDGYYSQYFNFRHGYSSYHVIDTGNVRAVRAF
jgi:hypothetical protein